MSLQRETRLRKRNESIKENYFFLRNQKKFTTEFILKKVADKYFLSPSTVERIIFTK